MIGAVGLALGWQPHRRSRPCSAPSWRCSSAPSAFASLGLFLAGVLRAEATLAAANLVYLLLLAGGAVVLPAPAVRRLRARRSTCLPSGALGDAMRGALIDGDARARATSLVLLVWAVVGTAPDREDLHVGVNATPGSATGSRWPGPLAGRPWSPTSCSSSPAGRCGSPAPGSAARPGRAAPTASFTPHGALGLHSAIEFGNRTLTFVLTAIASRPSSRRRQTGASRPAAARPSVLGLGDPRPGGARRHHRADRPQPVGRVASTCSVDGDRRASRVLFLRRLDAPGPASRSRPARRRSPGRRTPSTWVVLYVGTVVTGSGPHAGDATPPRNGLDPLQLSASCTPTWCSCSSA